MTKRLKAIPTTYKGIEFRSKLEARYARAFDKLGIVWEYEGHGFMFDDGTCYCPDFYMPEIDTYFEVKGVMDETSERKVYELARDGNRVVVGDPIGKLTMYKVFEEEPNDSVVVKGESTPARCTECGKAFFLDILHRWDCHACGAYDGDHLFELFCNDFETTVFEAVGW